MGFKKATKFESKARIAISGPSGSGKTYTSLILAHALAEHGKVAVIDTERGSASKYADSFPEFDVMELDSFHPNEYIKGIREAEQGGYDVLVIDSLSHAWNGQGGVLEIVEATAKRSQSKNTFNAWSEGTKVQNALIDAIVRSKLHIIVTMRSKTEYVIEQINGKNTPRKIGMAPVQRADLEYEFDCFFEMDYSNTLIVQKSRCSALANQVIEKPDASVAEILKAWLQGAPMPSRIVSSEKLNSIYSRGRKLGNLYTNIEEFATFIQLELGLDAPIYPKDMTEEQASDIEARIADCERQANQKAS